MPPTPEVHSLTAETQYDSQRSSGGGGRWRRAGRPPHFSITERQWGLIPAWGAAAVSPAPGLALREMPARRGPADPGVDTSPGFLFCKLSACFLAADPVIQSHTSRLALVSIKN